MAGTLRLVTHLKSDLCSSQGQHRVRWGPDTPVARAVPRIAHSIRSRPVAAAAQSAWTSFPIPNAVVLLPLPRLLRASRSPPDPALDYMLDIHPVSRSTKEDRLGYGGLHGTRFSYGELFIPGLPVTSQRLAKSGPGDIC